MATQAEACVGYRGWATGPWEPSTKGASWYLTRTLFARPVTLANPSEPSAPGAVLWLLTLEAITGRLQPL